MWLVKASVARSLQVSEMFLARVRVREEVGVVVWEEEEVRISFGLIGFSSSLSDKSFRSSKRSSIGENVLV